MQLKILLKRDASNDLPLEDHLETRHFEVHAFRNTTVPLLKLAPRIALHSQIIAECHTFGILHSRMLTKRITFLTL